MAGLFGGFNPYTDVYRYGGYGTGGGYYGSSQPTGSYAGPLTTQASPQIPSMQPSPQSFTPQSNIIWVNNEDEIKSYPTGRGWQQLFGDKNKNMFYIRETDMNGVMQPIRRLSYTFEDQVMPQMNQQTGQVPVQTQPVPQAQPPQPAQPMPQENGVSRDEFDKLSQAVNMMADKLSDLLK